MKKQKAIIFDIDGTVVDSPTQKLPSPRTASAFTKASHSYFICAATGRPWTFAKDIIQKLTHDPCIVAGGTQIRSFQGDILWESDLPKEALDHILKVIRSYPDHSLLFNDYEESAYLEDKHVKVDSIDWSKPMYFLELIFVPEDIALKLKTMFDEIDGIACTMVVAQREGMKDLHITNEFATKEHAITELLKIIQIDVDQTIGVGDGHNDLHLFAGVKTKIAMGNAVPELKEAADVVIGSVKDDGLAKYLEGIN